MKADLIYLPETDSYLFKTENSFMAVTSEQYRDLNEYMSYKNHNPKTANYAKTFKKNVVDYGNSNYVSPTRKKEITKPQLKHKEKAATLARFKSPPNRLRRWRYKLSRAYVRLLLLEDYLNVVKRT